MAIRSFLNSDEENQSTLLRDNLVYFVLFVVAVGLLIADYQKDPLANTVRSTVLRYSIPVVEVLALPVNALSFSIGKINDIVHLRRENDALRQEVQRLRNWFFVAQNLAQENTELREVLNYTTNTDLDFISARVLSKASGPFAESVLLQYNPDQQPIQVNMIAMVDNAVVGRVVRVGQEDATILLINDARSRVPVILQKNGERAMLAGGIDGRLTLRYLAKNATVEAGELVVTSGSGGLFPPGLPVGTIQFASNTEFFVKPVVNLERIEFVRLTRPIAGGGPTQGIN